MEITWAKSATKHRINHARSGHVVRTADDIYRVDDSAFEEVPLLFLGRDPNGVLLEVIAIETKGGVHVIHAMKIRPKYRPLLRGSRNA